MHATPDRLRALLRDMAPDDRALLDCRIVDGWHYRDIAAHLGVSRGVLVDRDVACGPTCGGRRRHSEPEASPGFEVEGGAGAGRAKTKTPAVESEVPAVATEIAALSATAPETPPFGRPEMRNSGGGIVPSIFRVSFLVYGSPRLDHNLFRRPVLAADSESC